MLFGPVLAVFFAAGLSPVPPCGIQVFSSGFESSCSGCPAPSVVSATAHSSNSICVEFSQLIDESSVLAAGGQFAIDGGLSAVAATPVGSAVLVETTFQTSDKIYELVVDPSISNTFGTGLAPGQNGAAFVGFNSGPTEHCGVIDADQTWAADPLGHLVTCDVTVQGGASPTLLIEDGARIAFDTGTGLYVGTSMAGNLLVQGSTMGVDMLSAASTPSPGEWTGVVIGPQAALVSLTGLNVEYATVGVNVQATGVSMDQVNVSASQSDGLWVHGSGSMSVADSQIHDNGGNGVLCDSSPCLTADFAGNVITGNAFYPFSMPTAVDVGRLDNSSSFSGNGSDQIRVRGSTSLGADATWLGHDVDLQLEGNLTVSAGAVLSISNMGITFDGSSTAYGFRILNLATLHADNSIFRSSPESNGAWLGLDFDSGASGSLISNSILYGANPDAVTLGAGTTISVTGNHIAHSNGYGIFCEAGCAGYTGSISANTFADNPTGDISP